MFDQAFTNLFGDGEVTAFSPDADNDWFLLSDYTQDVHYWHSKICDSFKVFNTNENDCYIIRGGVISDSGSGQIDISEGAAISKDSAGNARFVYIPALTNIDIPTGWNDDRQIWVVLKYDYKLGSSTRNHYEGTNYHYQLEDTYLGDTDGIDGGSTDDLFVATDPNSVADTIVCLGSFSMSAGDAFTEIAGERTSAFGFLINDVNKIEGLFQCEWTSPQLVGSGLSISGIGNSSIAALNGTDIAFIDSIIDELRTYRFNGSTWSIVGSGLSISGISIPALTALNGTDIAFIDSTIDELRTYRFNFTTNSWSIVGSGLSISGVIYPSIAALNGTDIAFIDDTIEELRTYRFNFTTNSWSIVGSGLSISGISIPALTALNGTDIAFIDSTIEELRTYRFGYSVSGSPYGRGDLL